MENKKKICKGCGKEVEELVVTPIGMELCVECVKKITYTPVPRFVITSTVDVSIKDCK